MQCLGTVLQRYRCSKVGAIYTEYITGQHNTNIVLSFNGTTHFINNSATKGGALFTGANCTLTFNGIVCFTDNGHGEGVIAMNGYLNFGGGVYMTKMHFLNFA